MTSRSGPGSLWSRGLFVLPAALVLALAAGCAKEPVVIDQMTGTANDLARCEALVAALPDELAGLSRRTVAPAAALGAAWGDPAVVLTCGVSDEIPPTAVCAEADGVGWYIPVEAISDQASTLEMTTMGRRPAVHLTVPGRYRPPPAIMVELAPALKEALEQVPGC